MRWFKDGVQPKQDHRMKEEWERVCAPEPPQGGDATFSISPYTGLAYDPRWDIELPPSFSLSPHRVPSGLGSFVPDEYFQNYAFLIGRYLSEKEHRSPVPRVDHQLFGKDER